MQAAIRPLVLPGVSHLARRYVRWSERKVKQSLLQMQLDGLQEWTPTAKPPSDVEVVPLSECGSEWLLRRVFNESAAGTPGFRPCRPIDIFAFSTSPFYDRRGVMLARMESRYVGTCIGRVTSSGTGMVYSLSVHADYRGRGVGRALLQASLEYVRKRGAHSAMLYFASDNEAALRLYLDEGFRVIGTIG
jgi:mycothiol synthase